MLTTGKLSQEQRELLTHATQVYAADLDLAVDYLERRGISKAIALTRGLGVVAKPVVGHSHLHGRLSIPYITPAGTVNMSFRCIQDHDCNEAGHNKYMKPQGNHTTLYGVGDIFKDTLDIGIVEGELDTIVMSEAVGFPCIGIPGADMWLPWWTDILRDFRRVFVFEDGDDPGRKMGDKVQKELGMSVVRVPYPDRQDTTTMYLKYGADKLREMIK